MEGDINDFVVETNGHCFLCLKRKLSFMKSSSEYESLTNHSPSNLLQCLSRYIQLDMRKVFCSEDLESIPPHLLAKVQTSKLKVELCEECASINQRFSGLYRQLEKIEMEMTSCLEVIMTKSESASASAGGWTGLTGLSEGKRKVVEALRQDVIEKGSAKIGKIDPTVRLERLARKDLLRNRNLKVDAVTEVQLNKGCDQPSRMKLEDNENEDCSMDSDDNNDYDNDFLTQQDANGDGVSGSSEFTLRTFSNDLLESDDVQNDSLTINNSSMTIVVPSTSEKISSAAAARYTNPETGKLKCKLCGKEFGGDSGFGYHYKSVHLKAKYKCNLCDAEFRNQPNYKRHHQSVHMGIRYKCLSCNRQFSQTSSLRKHQKTSSCCGKQNDLKQNQMTRDI